MTDPVRPPDPRTLEHLIDFVDTAAIGLHWVAPDGTILWANPADYEPLGYTAEEYIGHNITEFHADEAAITNILARLSAGERLTNYEARLRCRDGTERFVQITSSVLFEETPDGRRFVHTRCYTQDITERKRIDHARDRFVSILGHDLRNPLSAITLAADYLVKAEGVADAHRAVATKIVKSSERMARLIHDLIEVARHLGGRMPVRRSPVDFDSVCRRIVEEMQLAHPGLAIDCVLEGDLFGTWDEQRLAQAISNMVGNALQHGEPPVVVRARNEGEEVVLEVANRGKPIDADALAHLFEPFSQAAASEGLGLGLFIVREIVTAHGGTIAVRSEEEAGTVFISRWPRSAGD